MKRYDSLESIVRSMLTYNNELKTLLMIESDLSYKELCDQKVIVEEFREEVVSNDITFCKLAIKKDDDYVQLYVMCRETVMMLDTFEQRGIKIASIIHKYISTNNIIGNRKLVFRSIKNRDSIENWIVYEMKYSLEYYNSDENDDLKYLEVYNELWDKIYNRIESNHKLVKLLYGEDADIRTLIEEGYVRFNENYTKNAGVDSTRFLLIDVEDNYGTLLHTELVFDDSFSEKWAKETMDEFEKSMLGIVGAKLICRGSGKTLNDYNYVSIGIVIDLSCDTLCKVESERDVIRKIKISRRPNFFCGIEALSIMVEESMSDSHMEYDYDYTIDVIEAPYFVTYTSDKEQAIMRVYLRGVFYSRDDEGTCIGTTILDKTTGTVCVQANDSMKENMEILYKLCNNLNAYIYENDVMELVKDMNVREDGILLDTDEDELHYYIVKGKERPYLLCRTIFGGGRMCRPYRDENIED